MLALKSKSFAPLLATQLVHPKPNAAVTTRLPMPPAPVHGGLAGREGTGGMVVPTSLLAKPLQELSVQDSGPCHSPLLRPCSRWGAASSSSASHWGSGGAAGPAQPRPLAAETRSDRAAPRPVTQPARWWVRAACNEDTGSGSAQAV